MYRQLNLAFVLPLLAALVFTQDRSTKSCEDGFYFDNTECQPCSSNCTSCLSMSSCGSCKEGLYGETCSLACPSNCYHNTCNKTTGFCDSCANGFFVNKNQACERCPNNCQVCVSESDCSACNDGYKGKTCTQECSNCKHKTGCDQDNGYCFLGCKDGLSGNHCDKLCDAKCLSCSRHDVNSCETCAHDKHGIHCDHKCSDTCRSEQCNRSDGFCTFGCKDGFWNKTCELACSDGCLKNVCHMITGACLDGCLEGFGGTSCIQQDGGKRRKSSPDASEFFPVIIGFVVIMCFSTVCLLFYKSNYLKKIKDFYRQRIMYKHIKQNNANYV